MLAGVGTPTSDIDTPARALEELPVSERLRVDRRTLGRIGLSLLVALVVLVVIVRLTDVRVDSPFSPFLPTIVVLAFVFETLDSSAGMGFGTALAALFFALGYEPLAVVPSLLVTQAATGFLAGWAHHQFGTVEFSVRPPFTQATEVVGILAGVGIVATVLTITIAYLAFAIPARAVKIYVALLILVLGGFGLLRQYLPTTPTFRPDRLLVFAAIAGFNKGIGGGGFGAVVTMGQIYAGVYEKPATAITVLAEGLVALVGSLTYLFVLWEGIPVDFGLLPSVFAGGLLAAILGPFSVRVLPNWVLRYGIPIYAVIVAVFVLVQGL